jgi:predicted RNA-binding protein
MTTSYWLLVASRDHVLRGVEGGFAQANHGRPTALRRMQQGDRILYYSGKAQFGTQIPCRRFTALGEVADETVFQVSLPDGFSPYRRRVNYQPCREVEIAPLIPELTFIKNKHAWGLVLRRGAFTIPAEDYQRIAAQMLAQEGK